MKSIMRLYDNCRNAVRISYFGFFLIAIGYLIQNESVNIFYTFTNSTLLIIAKGSYELGKIIILNLPLIFMVNLVCKRANSGFPIILALIGYCAFLITISLFAASTYDSYVYNTAMGGLIKSTLSGNPYETGLIGSFIVAMITRFSYIASRNKNKYTILGFLNKDSVAIIYNLILSALAGLIIAYLFPIAFGFLGKLISYISGNLADARRIALYGFADRVLSILGLGQLIRYPFWYTSLGGSYSSILTGQVVVGDINIWNYIQDAASTYSGAGRFITPYYVINMFVVPGIYLGMYFSMSDKKEKTYHLIPMIAIIGMSVVCGNPLPVELSLLFTAPLLLVIYLVVVSAVFLVMSYFNIYLGFPNVSNEIIAAMPGSFPDYIINLRNINLTDAVTKIFFVGIVFLVVMFLLTLLYYRFLAYDVLQTGKKEEYAVEIIDAVGGIQNISRVSNGLLKVNVELYDLEIVSASKVQKIRARRVTETKEGISIELGVSSEIIARNLSRQIKKQKKEKK